MTAPQSLRVLSEELAVLGLDLQTTLREEPRFLLDACFLGALHLELSEQLGPRDAHAALLQLGFLHGLRDASALVMDGFGPGASFQMSTAPVAARLAIHLQPNPSGRVDIHGAWPERHEAEAVLASCGPQSSPTCHVSTGYTSGWLTGIYDTDVLVIERACAASGQGRCSFQAKEARAWLAEGSPPALASLAALPFGELRDVVAAHLENEAPLHEPPTDSFEAGAPIVHVWGPVMVIPFAGPDESLRALDLIGRDPGAREVRVVVVDLSGAIIDEGFGAAALEQILDAIEGWGAEPILAGVSPLSEGVIADLEKSHLVVHKDLPGAIAAGFQIAEAQRRSS